jgi:hypothetical protein
MIVSVIGIHVDAVCDVQGIRSLVVQQGRLLTLLGAEEDVVRRRTAVRVGLRAGCAAATSWLSAVVMMFERICSSLKV